MGLSKDPHEFGDGSFQGHVVSFQETKLFFDGFADFVDGHVASLVGDLRCHDDKLAGIDPAFNSPVEAVVLVGRDAAYAEGLNNDCIIVLKQVIQNAAIHGRNQL